MQFCYPQASRRGTVSNLLEKPSAHKRDQPTIQNMKDLPFFHFWIFLYVILYCFICHPRIPLCRRRRGLLRIWHWQPDVLTTKLDTGIIFGRIYIPQCGSSASNPLRIRNNAFFSSGPGLVRTVARILFCLALRVHLDCLLETWGQDLSQEDAVLEHCHARHFDNEVQPLKGEETSFLVWITSVILENYLFYEKKNLERTCQKIEKNAEKDILSHGIKSKRRKNSLCTRYIFIKNFT